MNNNLTGNKNENQKIESDAEAPLYNADKLISISVLAKYISWLILAVSLAFFVVCSLNISIDVSESLSYGYSPDADELTFFLLSLFPSLIGLFLYVILRVVAESIFLFMDIEIGLREMNERKK